MALHEPQLEDRGRFPVDLRTVQVNGNALACVERGAGENVVFVHGTSQDIRTWRNQITDVASRYRTIAYSRRYSRPNDDIAPGDDDPMEPHVEDLMELLSLLDAKPAHLVGSSWGAFICLLAAIGAPGVVRTLVLCEPPVLPLFISNNPGPGELVRLFARRPLDAIRIIRFGLGVMKPTIKAYRAGDNERGARIFGEALVGKRGLESMPPERRTMLEENTAAEVAQLLGQGFPPLRADDVRRVQAPTLLVAGQRSPALFRATLIAELERLLPNTERVEIPDSTHLMHEENPTAFNADLLSFLDRHS
jgi:pimeloyl-ACP methyl ester carboxylesterase